MKNRDCILGSRIRTILGVRCALAPLFHGKISSRVFSYCFFLFLLVWAVVGCASAGGGTSGTGVLRVAGVLRGIDSERLSGVTISARTSLSDDSALSDENGEYVLEIVLDSTREVAFSFLRAPDIDWNFSLTIAPSTERITIEWRGDGAGNVSVTAIDAETTFSSLR